MKDLTVTLENVPGTLATLGEALGHANVNVEAACAFETETGTVVHVLVEDGVAAREVLEGAGLAVDAEQDAIALYVSGEDRPGTLGRNARKIAEAGVNIRWAYFATRSRLVFVTNDNAKARAALRV